MKKTFLLFAMIGLMIVACSSPEEKKLEKDTGYKLSEVNKALKIKKDFEVFDENVKNKSPNNSNEADLKKIIFQGEEMAKKVQGYEPIYQALEKFLYQEPEAYLKLFGKNGNYPVALLVKNAKNNPELLKMAQDIKDFLNGLDKQRLKRDNPYKLAMRKEYTAKANEFIEKYAKISYQFLETSQDLKDKEKQSLDLHHCWLSSHIYCYPVKIFGLEFPN